MSWLRTLTLVGVALCIASAPLRAEGTVGKDALEAGRTALEAEDFDTACEEAVRALEEDPKLYAAMLLHGEALLGAGRREEGVERLRGLLTLLERAVPLSEDAKSVWVTARERLFDVSPRDRELDALLQQQAVRLAKVGKKWLKKNARAAERASLAALAMDPTHAASLELLEASRAGFQGTTQKLLDPTRSKWTWLSAEHWPSTGGATIVGHSETNQIIARTNAKWSGEFDVVVEARIVESFPKNGPVYLGVLVPFVSKDRHFSFGSLIGVADLAEVKSDGNTSMAHIRLAELGDGIDPTTWVRYEVRLRKNVIIALVNGIEVGRALRPAYLKGGYVGLSVQCARVEFRRADLIHK